MVNRNSARQMSYRERHGDRKKSSRIHLHEKAEYEELFRKRCGQGCHVWRLGLHLLLMADMYLAFDGEYILVERVEPTTSHEMQREWFHWSG